MKRFCTLFAILMLIQFSRAATTNDGVAVRVPIPSATVASLLVHGLAGSTSLLSGTELFLTNLVNRSGTQTVAGIKTFTGQLIASNGVFGGSVDKLTNGTWFNPTLSNGVNRGSAFSSPGTGIASEQFGSGATTAVGGALAVGANAKATNAWAAAIGNGTTAGGQESTALGVLAQAHGLRSMAIGSSAFSSNATDAIALGTGSIATNANSIAFGNGSRTTADNQIVLGSASHTVVAAGRLVDTTISNATISAAIQLLTGGVVSNTTLKSSTLTNNTIQGGTIAGSAISGGTVSGAAVTDGTITNAAIAGGTIAGAAITGGTIAGATSISGTVGALAGGTYTGGTLAGATAVSGNLALQRFDNTSLATGANADVNISTNSFVRFPSGPGGAYSISGLTAGANGQVVTLYFPLSYPVTIKNDTGTTANRIYTLAGGDVTSSGACAATLIYDSSAARWILVGFWRDTGQQVYGTNVVGAVAWSGNATNANTITNQKNSATITASETSTTTNIVQRSITGSIAGTTLRLWNATQGKYQEVTLSGAAGTEHLTVTDIP
jgi:hypothetical protein